MDFSPELTRIKVLGTTPPVGKFDRRRDRDHGKPGESRRRKTSGPPVRRSRRARSAGLPRTAWGESIGRCSASGTEETMGSHRPYFYPNVQTKAPRSRRRRLQLIAIDWFPVTASLLLTATILVLVYQLLG
jgi:hypothetical protein